MISDYLFTISKSIISIPFIFFIPGFLLDSIIYGKKSVEFDSFIFLHICTSIIITSFAGLILAQMGLFSLMNLILILLAISTYLYYKFIKLNIRANLIPVIPINPETIVVFCLILSSIFLFFQPFLWIASGRDTGVYVSSGVHIAKSGSIFIKDPLIAQMNASIQDALYIWKPLEITGNKDTRDFGIDIDKILIEEILIYIIFLYHE